LFRRSPDEFFVGSGLSTVAVSKNATARVEIVLAQTAQSVSKK
jgi:hypothetical protein